MTKVFIISLPRTGTTSVSVFLLDHGFKVAHTCFSEQVLQQADVVADTPVFIDYKQLYLQYPNSKFIYLNRPIELWLVSIKKLLRSLQKQWRRNGHLFNEHIHRCFEEAFPNFLSLPEIQDEFLRNNFNRHKREIEDFFSDKINAVLYVDITQANAGVEIVKFVNNTEDRKASAALPHVNVGRSINYWRRVEHKNKLRSG